MDRAAIIKFALRWGDILYQERLPIRVSWKRIQKISVGMNLRGKGTHTVRNRSNWRWLIMMVHIYSDENDV
jgi:hypothetical protein